MTLLGGPLVQPIRVEPCGAVRTLPPTLAGMLLLRSPLALLVLLLALAGCARVGGEPFQPTLNSPVTLEPDAVLGQTFNPAGTLVQAVEVQVATFDAPADAEGVLTLVLREPVGGGLLDTAQVAGADLADASWVRASFDTAVEVPDVVLAEVSWDGATPLALWANLPLSGDGSESIVNDPYAGGQLVRDGRPAEGDLAFRVIGGGGVGAGAAQVVEVARSTGAGLLDEPVFAVLWGLALVGCGALAVVGLRRRGALVRLRPRTHPREGRAPGDPHPAAAPPEPRP